jgi:hypothetical protein
MLKRYYNSDTGSSPSSLAAKLLFNDDPLNHPCNWGKLNFGNNFAARVVVPLYYEGKDENGDVKIYNPNTPRSVGDSSSATTLSQLKIRVRTPCLPIAERDGQERSQCREDTATGKRPNTPECRYEDVCKSADRYQFDIGDGSIDEDKTVVDWKILGSCTFDKPDKNGKIASENCALLPRDEFDTIERIRETGNTEIYQSVINNYDGSFSEEAVPIKESIKGKVAYYSKDCRDEEYFKCNNDTIGNFIKMIDPIILTLAGDSVTGYTTDESYTSINKPLLQLSITVDDLKDIEGRSIPYLEYQVVTDVPVSNTTQEFKTEINYGGQAFQQSYSIEQKKNVVDFALQD